MSAVFDNAPFASGPHKGQPRGFRCTCSADCDFKAEGGCEGNVKPVGIRLNIECKSWVHSCKAHAEKALKEEGVTSFELKKQDWDLPGPQRF